MSALRALAPAKVNLGLWLGPRRPDDRHELLTVYESISLADELTLAPSHQDEVVCPGVPGENLVSAALARLRQRGWAAPPVRIEIVKRIPVAAGLGGGSADAAAALRLAAALTPDDAATGPTTLGAIAAELGSDVPGQLAPGLWLGTGAGEVVEPLPALASHAFVIVPQPFALRTAAVYAEADRLGLPRGRDALRAREARLRRLQPGARLDGEALHNDLQAAAISLRPEIAQVLSQLQATAVDAAFVCGSGPTVAGLRWEAPPPAGALTAVPVDAAFGAPKPVSSSRGA